MRKFRRIIRLILALIMLLLSSSCSPSESEKREEPITIRLVAPQNGNIQDFETNWYKLWMEEETGLKLEITWLPLEDAEQIVRQQLQSGEGMPDAYVGFGSGFGGGLESDFVFSNLNLIHYGNQGMILPLDELIEEYGVHTKQVFEDYPEIHLKEGMTSADGHIYFMPGYSTSIIKRYRPLMFVNKGWLDALDMEVPTTTEQFYEMLKVFATEDPNSNGLPDEIPICGTEAFYDKQVYDFIFNAFIYNDDTHTRLYPEDGKLLFAPVRDGWRDALRYMRMLYDEGLFSPLNFTQDDQQMKQMANDERDILGAFTASNFSYTVYQNSEKLISRWVGIAPLEGPDGARFATVNTPLPKVSAVITSACKHPVELFKLFDLMLSEEWSLNNRFGEPGVDWEFAKPGDVDIYGTQATIRILHQLLNTPQNKHLQQITPHVTPTKYNMGITWDGTLRDGDYFTAQTALLYQDYDPPEYITLLPYTPDEEAAIAEIRTDIEKRVKDTLRDFVTGSRDVNDDAEWERYIGEYDALGLQEFISAAQAAYNRTQ